MLRRKRIYGDMYMESNDECYSPLVETHIQKKFFGLFWITIKKVKHQ